MVSNLWALPALQEQLRWLLVFGLLNWSLTPSQKRLGKSLPLCCSCCKQTIQKKRVTFGNHYHRFNHCLLNVKMALQLCGMLLPWHFQVYLKCQTLKRATEDIIQLCSQAEWSQINASFRTMSVYGDTWNLLFGIVQVKSTQSWCSQHLWIKYPPNGPMAEWLIESDLFQLPHVLNFMTL